MRQPGVIIDGSIAIDKFSRNVNVQYNFLSHAHADHYAPVDGKWRNGFIYCSPITAQLLPVVTGRPKSKRGGICSKYIRALQINIWHQMDGFAVMLIDANHIPGAVMFLFEGTRIPDGRILFTGDFRADSLFYQNIFAASVLQEKRLSTIFLDNTYISSTHQEFPSREASLAKIISLLRELLYDGAHPVAIVVPKIGREKLLVNIAVEFKCRIFVNPQRYKIAEILGLSEYFTTEHEETFIWTCAKKYCRSMLNDANSCVIDISMLPSIKPSSLIYDDRMHYIGYSDHCSPNEIRDFLSQLSFSHIKGLSVEMSKKQIDALEQLSLPGADSVSIEEQNDEMIVVNDLNTLLSPVVLNRVGLAYCHAVRNVFDSKEFENDEHSTEIQVLYMVDEGQQEVDEQNEVFPEIMEAQSINSQEENTNVTSNRKDVEMEEGIENTAEENCECVKDENIPIFDSTIRDNLGVVNLENLVERFLIEINDDSNMIEFNSLRELLDEMDFSKSLEILGDVYEDYQDAVNALARKRTVQSINAPYSAEKHVAYDASRCSSLIDTDLRKIYE